MAGFVGYKCDGCHDLVETTQLPDGWMVIKPMVCGSFNGEFTVCSNLCLERLGRKRKEAEKELVKT